MVTEVKGTAAISSLAGTVVGGDLLLQGPYSKCREDVARVIEMG